MEIKGIKGQFNGDVIKLKVKGIGISNTFDPQIHLDKMSVEEGEIEISLIIDLNSMEE